MRIRIQNCNNIDNGEFEIQEGHLNIIYAPNGTGKSTIARAVDAFVNNDDEKKNSLLPFKYYESPDDNSPELSGFENIKAVSIFNEDYIGNYVFQQDELLTNSFEIFVKNDNYEKHMKEIESLLKNINVTFEQHPELDTLLSVFYEFIGGFGRNKSGYSAAGAIGKGLGNGNKINNIPEGLEGYAPYLKSDSNVKWIKWQLEGKTYLDMAEQCPYCSGSVENTKSKILKVGEEYDSKAIEHLNKMLEVFSILTPYLSKETAKKLDEISKSTLGINDVYKNFLIEIKQQVENLLSQLQKLKGLSFQSLKNIDKVSDEIQTYKIDLSFYSHFNSELSKEKINIINSTLNELLEKAGKLQGEVAQQKLVVRKAIETHNEEINNFLHYAGYKYNVSIEGEDDSEEYHLILRHNEGKEGIASANEHLSYGERNAFALVLFMYNALKNNPDMVILDDPISSFDGNKKFAILNMLFMGTPSLKNRTVLLLTHEFNTVIDTIYNMPYNFSPAPSAIFLSVKKGLLDAKEIHKTDIKSFMEIADANMKLDMDNLNKLIYLRRLREIQNTVHSEDVVWQLLSNLFHKRSKTEIQFQDSDSIRPMTTEELEKAETEIRSYIPDFDYDNEFQKTQNVDLLKELYKNSKSNYEKLQIYRIIFNENNGNLVVRKFVNETFHIENDYLYQLNPREYETVPQYIIDECDKDIFSEEQQ